MSTLTLQEASQLMGVNEMTIRRHIKQGKLKARKQYGRYIIEESDMPFAKIALERAKMMKENEPLGQAPSSAHYKSCKIEPLEYIEANGLGFHAGNVVKYVSRYEEKGGLDDLRKARWYIDRLIQIEEGKQG